MIKETSLDIKVGSGNSAPLDVVFKIIPEDKYNVELVRVYKWRKTVKDTMVAIRDENGKVVKLANGDVAKELVKNLEWYNADVLFKILDGEYAGVAVKGSLSTHPEMQRNLKQFLYCAGLFGVTAGEVENHLGAKLRVKTKNETRTYEDKETGVEKEVTDVKVHWYVDPKEAITEDFEIE